MASLEAGPYETWMESGAPTLEQRANGRWKAMFAAYEAPPIDAGVEEALDEYVARRKSGMADERY